MTSIKSLPVAVRSKVRSGVIIDDLTRVVEELIFNSLDARASKVTVFVGIGTCYVKVVDNGSGVTRDGLLLMGERYATSKFDDLSDEHAASDNFGFRGEALASISDVSLLEIVSKANGKPNGYRKVVKGSKSLFLGIDNDRKDVGTTVVVRDLYYNQPVRRKHIQSSPKKVLQSVNKCALRIALMHSQVSFEVIDIESEDMLLCTHPSSTLSLLTSAFGMEIATSLHELNMDDGNFKLFGYISGPCDNLTIKAFQYVYINSRFVYKGPVHKLLNQLAAKFERWDQATIAIGQQSKKRNRPQVYPAFILNIRCPRSFYDLTFESSKTFVHFKDITAVQMVIDKAIQTLGREDIFYGFANPMGHIKGKEQITSGHGNILSPNEDLLDELPKKFITRKKMCSVQNRQASLELPASTCKLIAIEDELSCLSRAEHDVVPIQFSNQNPDDLRDQKHELDFGLSRAELDVVPIQFSNQNTDDLRGQDLELDFGCQNGSSFQSWDFSLARSKPKASGKHENHLCISGDNFLSTEEFYLENRVTATECSGSGVESFNLPWENESSEVNFIFDNGSAVRALSCDYEGFSKNLEMSEVTMKPILKSCSSTYSTERELCMDGELDFQSGVLWAKEIGTGHYNPEIDDKKQSFSLLQDHGSITQNFSRDMTNSPLSSEVDSLPRELLKSIPSYVEHVNKINGFPSGFVTNTACTGLNSEWFSVNLKPLSQLVPWDVQHNIDNDILGGSCTSSGNHFVDVEENNCRLSFGTMSKSTSQENCSTSCKNSQLDYAHSSKFLERHNLNNNFPPECSDFLIDESDWLGCDSQHVDHSSVERHETQRNWIPHQGAKNTHFKQRARSSSAPPLYKRKRRISTLKYTSTVTEDEPYAPIRLDNGDMTHLHQSSGIGHRHLTPSVSMNLLLDTGRDMKNMQDVEEEKMKIQKDVKYLESTHIQDTDAVTGLLSEAFQESPNNWTKWRNGYPLTATKNKLYNMHYANNILDISSGFLHFAGDSLVPGSIDKNFLNEARVLQQLDKKFIPVVAGRSLAVIDQHAADERIRLEELRQKVLSGEAKTITFLDAEQELMLPEIGHQLLHNYAEMIQEWGWICNIHAHNPMSFKRNLNLLHRRPAVLTLIAVPCIFGVNLTDTDLMEFLQQLADTDGSSTMPPSVLRILNSKACRGAIMFGDSLLPSECSLIVEELKKTSLCFQCAHGRPTTAPLVNLEVLHEQIGNISLLSGEDNILLQHGLCRHELSVERATRRLKSR